MGTTNGVSNECVQKGCCVQRRGLQTESGGALAFRGRSEEEELAKHPRPNCLCPGCGRHCGLSARHLRCLLWTGSGPASHTVEQPWPVPALAGPWFPQLWGARIPPLSLSGLLFPHL